MQRSSSLNGMYLAKCGIAVLLGFSAMWSTLGSKCLAWGSISPFQFRIENNELEGKEMKQNGLKSLE